MDIKNISKKIANFVENLLEEEIKNEVNDRMSEDYQMSIDEELKAFEDGIDDDDSVIDMVEDDINDQTAKFIKLHAKK